MPCISTGGTPVPPEKNADLDVCDGNILSTAQIAIPNLDDGVLKRTRQEPGKGRGKGHGR